MSRYIVKVQVVASLPDLDMYALRTGSYWTKGGGPDIKEGFHPCELCLRPVNPATGHEMLYDATSFSFVDPAKKNDPKFDRAWIGPECFKKYPQLKPYKLK